MADRFPLVANSSTSQIQEIPSGDTLDLSGNNVKGVGIITATTFSGNLTGNVTGNVTGNASGTSGGLSGTPNITVGTVTGTDATFSGNLTVQGTTTTIDTAVTAVDSLQIDGNVAIGTITAGRHLTVSGGASEGAIQITNNTSGHFQANGFELIHFTSGETQFLNRESGDMRFDTNGGEKLRIRSNGNIGLGTLSPGSADAALDIKKDNADIKLGKPGGQYHRLKSLSTGEFTINDNDTAERLRIGSSGEIGLSGANYGTAGQVLTSQGSGSAAQWAAPAASGISAGARSTNPNTTSVEWTSLPANIQAIEVGYADAYASTNNGQDERIVLRLGTSAGYLTSNYKNRSWNMYASSIGLGFNSSRAAFIPYYWIDNTDRATNIFILRRMGTTNTFQATWQEYIAGGHSYIAMGTGYIDLGAELTQVKLQTINGTATLNGSFWMNYTTR